MLRTLAEEGVSPILINSHVTPLSLFKQFFDHRAGEISAPDECGLDIRQYASPGNAS